MLLETQIGIVFSDDSGVFIKPRTVTKLRTLGNLGTDLWLIRVLLSHKMAATRCVFQTLLTLHTRKTGI